MSDFNWTGDDAEAIVLTWQHRTAVYANTSGGVVVRREGDGYDDRGDDQVLLTPMGALAVAWEMIRIAHEIGIPVPPPDLRRPIDLGPSGPVVVKPAIAEPGPLLAVMEAANERIAVSEAAE